MNYKLLMLLIVFGVMFCMVYLWYNTKSYNKNLYASEQRYVFQIESLKSEIKAQQQIIQKLRENARNYQSLNNAKEQSLSVMRDKLEKMEVDKIKATQEIDRLSNEYKKVSMSKKIAQEKEDNETEQGIKKYQKEVKKMKSKLKNLNNEYDSMANNKKKDSTGIENSKIDDQFENKKKNEDITQIEVTKKNHVPVVSSNTNDVQRSKFAKFNEEKGDKDNKMKTTTQLNTFSSKPDLTLVTGVLGKRKIKSPWNKFKSKHTVQVVTGFIRNMKNIPQLNKFDSRNILRPVNGIKRENQNSDDLKESKIGNEENKIPVRHRPNFEMNDNKDKSQQQNMKVKKSKSNEDLDDSREKGSNSMIKKHSNENEPSNNNNNSNNNNINNENNKKKDEDFNKAMGILKNPKFANKFQDNRFHGQNNLAGKQALND